jgi:hypothetical protein
MSAIQEARIVVDPDWYLSTYPDVAGALMKGRFRSALQHYLAHGFQEGRLPVPPSVDEVWYIAMYPDVAEAIGKGSIGSARQHFIQSGYREGRLPCAGMTAILRNI